MPLSRVFIIVAFFISLAACGGGGGGGGTTGNSFGSTAPAAVTMLTGQVLVPNGVVASLAQPSLADMALDLVFPAAAADLNGIVPAPAGTTVELVRLNSFAEVSAILATTTTDSNGRYSFDLSNLGLSPEITLAVQVRNNSNVVILRAFVSSTGVDITPESETVFREIHDAILDGIPFGNITVEEVTSLVRALRNLSTNSGEVVGINISNTVENLLGIFSADRNIIEFRDAATAPGRVLDGQRQNIYFPIFLGARYSYAGDLSVTIDGETSSIEYRNETTVADTITVQGVTTSKFRSSNLLGIGANDSYFANTLEGIVDYTDVVNGDSSLPIPIVLLPFASIRDEISIDDNVVANGQAFQITYQSFPKTSLSVGVGTFTDVIHTRVTANSLSSTDQVVFDYYFARNTGLIRQDFFIRENGDTVSGTEQLTNVTTGVTRPPFLASLDTSFDLDQLFFGSRNFEYTASVDFETDTVSVNGLPEDIGALVSVNGQIVAPDSPAQVSLNVGQNRVVVTVVRGDSTEYVLNINRLGPRLDALSVDASLSDGVDINFRRDTLNYEVGVGLSAQTTAILASSLSPSAVITIGGQVATQNEPVEISLVNGSDTPVQVILKQDGATTVYNVLFTRPALIQNFMVSESIDQIFQPSLFDYTASVSFFTTNHCCPINMR